MKRVLLVSCVIGSVLGLGACQNMAHHQAHNQTHHASESVVRQSIAVDRSMCIRIIWVGTRTRSRIC